MPFTHEKFDACDAARVGLNDARAALHYDLRNGCDYRDSLRRANVALKVLEQKSAEALGLVEVF